MKDLEINIALDPVTDGASVIRVDEERESDAGALVIATNGEYRRIDPEEAYDILSRMPKTAYAEHLGKSPYMAVFNDEKIFEIREGRYFIGSVVILKWDEDGPDMLSGDDYDRAKKEFISRLSWLVVNGQKFTAYEM
ncbi:MAG: hypothetical protein J6X66_06580 [Lachnospiraceae bacterium]|nr:hypothetical protein [Lachnospiraceae bacterium]